MIAVIAAKDFRGFVRDGRLAFVVGLSLVLLIAAIVAGWRLRNDTAAERDAAQDKGYETWLSQGPKNPHSAAHLGMHLFRPDPPLALLEPGLEPFVGQVVRLDAHRQNDFGFRPAQDATGLRRFGDLSAAFVLQTLAPLLVILLGFDALAGERENGTLRQLASLGVGPSRLLLGKALAIGAAAAAALLPALALSLAALAEAAASDALADTIARLGWIALAHGLYLGAFLFVTLAVSAAAATSRTALVVLLAIWTATAIIVPRAASEGAHALAPTPSRAAFATALQAEVAAAARKVFEENFHATGWSQVAPEDSGLALRLEDQSGYAVFDRHYDRLWELFERQRRLEETLGAISPLVALRGLSAAMAGTDLTHQRAFATAAETYRRLIQDKMSGDRIAHGGALGYNYQAPPALWAEVPPFRFEGPTSAATLARRWPALASLAAAFILSLLAAAFAAHRLRPI